MYLSIEQLIGEVNCISVAFLNHKLSKRCQRGKEGSKELLAGQFHTCLSLIEEVKSILGASYDGDDIVKVSVAMSPPQGSLFEIEERLEILAPANEQILFVPDEKVQFILPLAEASCSQNSAVITDTPVE